MNPPPLKKYILNFVFICYAVLMSIPWQPGGFSYDLDESFKVALHEAFAAKVQFGKDFIYTYGPYGILQGVKYFPETYSAVALGYLFIGLVMGFGLVCIVNYCWKKNKWSVIFLFPFLFFFPNSGISLDSFFSVATILPLLFYFYINKGKISPILLFLVVGAAFAGLIKQTFLGLGIAFILLITVDQIFRRRFPVILTVYLTGVLAFWLLAGQNLANFGAYLANGSQIVKGFAATMGTFGPLIEIILYLITVVLFLGLVVAATWSHRSKVDLLPVAGLAVVFFLIFKGAFVRHDSGHAMQSAMSPIPIACLYSALLWSDLNKLSLTLKRLKTKVPVILISWILFLINASLIFQNSINQGYFKYYLDAMYNTPNTGKAALQMFLGQADLKAIYNDSFAMIRKENSIPQLTGTTDLYPNETAVIFAYDLPYKPRPVIQSFSAYTAKLAELNATHLRDPDAPETILFAVSAIDNRLPSSDDGLSWPELLTRYDITDITGKFLVLKRRSNPGTYTFTSLLQGKAKMGDWVELPDKSNSDAIWMQLDARPGLLGKLMTTLFKLPPLYLEVELADGKSEKYRVLADIMHSGQLLSPLVKDKEDFIALASPIWQELLQNSAVKRMRLVAEDWGLLAYPQSYSINLSRFEFSRQDFSQVPGWSDYSNAMSNLTLLKSGEVFHADNRGLEKKVGPDGKPVLLAHADTRIVISLPEGSQKLSIGYGILDGAWQEAKEKGGSADGVEFRVIAIYPDDKEEILFSKWLDPHANANDRGEKTAEIDLTRVSTQRIALDTLQGPKQDSSWDWSYWSEVKAQ